MATISEMFKVSPFEPLRHHMISVKNCVALVWPMFDAVRDQDDDKLQDLCRRVFKAEHEADIIKNEIRQSIPKRFFLPVYRGDLLGYVKLQDDMADAAEDIAVLLTLKKLTIHKTLVDPLIEYLAKVKLVCEHTYEISEYLPKLIDGDMTGPEADHAVEMVARVEKDEWEADRLQYSLSQKLYAVEDDMKATDVMLWSKVYGEVGQLANFAEKTGERLRRMLAS